MLDFSANLGFLWQELSLCGAVRAASSAGFAAVECHWPFDTAAADLRAVLDETGLPMLSLNTHPGDREAGEFGLAALPGRESAARAAIDEAIAYAARIGCRKVHVMAGITDEGRRAGEVFLENLRYACDAARASGIDGILVEPINRRDVPGYHLSTVEAAVDIVEKLGQDNLEVMFDCYHVQLMQGDLLTRFTRHLDHIGHVQLAAVPDRGEPDAGEVDFADLLPAMQAAGYRGFFGAEYRPRAGTDDGLAWLAGFTRGDAGGRRPVR